MSKQALALVLTLGWTAIPPSQAQDLPATQVWLLDISGATPTGPQQISAGKGYHNQPAFSGDGNSIFFTSEQGDGQTDIVQYIIADGSRHVVLASPESEYSPTPIPGQAAISVIRVEIPDQRQRLWKIPLDGEEPSVLFPDVEPVGYHAWLDEKTAILFILGETFDLHLAQLGSPGSTGLAKNIGRTLRLHPQTRRGLFVDKNSEPWKIASFAPGEPGMRAEIDLFPGVEDFDVDESGRYWMGSGSKLYRSTPDNSAWRLDADLREWGITGITRLVVSLRESKIAIVGY